MFPRRKKLLAIPLLLGISHVFGIWLIPYDVLENAVKWCHFHSELIYLGFGTFIPLMLIPGILFLLNSIFIYKSKELRHSLAMKKNSCLASGSFILGVVEIFEGYGRLTYVLPFWHSMVLLSFLLLYFGFTLKSAKK